MTNTVRYEAHPSMFRNRPLLFIVCIALIAVYGVGLLILIVWRIRAISNKVLITDDSIQYEKGLLSKTRVDLRISNIRTVRVSQGVVQRMLGAGDVEIYTAGDKPEFVIGGVRDPHQVRRLLGGGI